MDFFFLICRKTQRACKITMNKFWPFVSVFVSENVLFGRENVIGQPFVSYTDSSRLCLSIFVV